MRRVVFFSVIALDNGSSAEVRALVGFLQANDLSGPFRISVLVYRLDDFDMVIRVGGDKAGAVALSNREHRIPFLDARAMDGEPGGEARVGGEYQGAGERDRAGGVLRRGRPARCPESAVRGRGHRR